jgi:hypothetical protein
MTTQTCSDGAAPEGGADAPELALAGLAGAAE